MPNDENTRRMAIKTNNYENMTGSLRNGCREGAAIRNIFLRYLSLLWVYKPSTGSCASTRIESAGKWMPANRVLPTGNRRGTLLDPFVSVCSYFNVTKM